VGMNARKLIEEQHDISKMTSILIGVYQSLLV
jgi:hypothetical protein